jgi:hypothetical protein
MVAFRSFSKKYSRFSGYIRGFLVMASSFAPNVNYFLLCARPLLANSLGLSVTFGGTRATEKSSRIGSANGAITGPRVSPFLPCFANVVDARLTGDNACLQFISYIIFCCIENIHGEKIHGSNWAVREFAFSHVWTRKFIIQSPYVGSQ